MTRIRFTEPATQDLEEIYDYIALDNVEAAERLRTKLQKRWRAAGENPGIGRKRDEWQPNLRSVREGNYLILYQQRREDSRSNSNFSPLTWLGHYWFVDFRVRLLVRVLTLTLRHWIQVYLRSKDNHLSTVSVTS